MHFQDVGTFTSIYSQSNKWSKSSERLDTTENFSEFFKAALQEAEKNNRPFDWKDTSFLAEAKKATHIDQELFNNFPKFDRQELFKACPNLLIYINLNNEEEYPIPVKNLFGSPLFKHQIDGESKDGLCYTEGGSLSLPIRANDLEIKRAFTAFFEIYGDIAKMDSLPLDQLLDILVTNDYFQDEGIYKKADECLLTFLGNEDETRIFLHEGKIGNIELFNEGKISRAELFSKLREKYHSLELFPKIESLSVQFAAKNGDLLRDFDKEKEAVLKRHGPMLDSIYFPLTDDIDKDREILKAILDSCPNMEELLLPETGAFLLEELKFQGKLGKIGIGKASIYSQKILEKTCEFVGKGSTIQGFIKKIQSIADDFSSTDFFDSQPPLNAMDPVQLFKQAFHGNIFYASYGLSEMKMGFSSDNKKEYIQALIKMDPKLHLNKKFMIDATKWEPTIFESTPHTFKRDGSFIHSILLHLKPYDCKKIVPFIDEELRNDPDFMRPLLLIHGAALQSCGEKIRKNRAFIKEIADASITFRSFIPDEFKNDAAFMKPYIEQKARYLGGVYLKEYTLKCIENDFKAVEYIDKEFKENIDFLKEIITLHGNGVFQHMSIEMRNNPDIANFAMSRDPQSIQSIGETLKKDKKFMKPLIAKYGSIAFKQASKKVQRSVYGFYFMQRITNIFTMKS